MTPAEAAAFRLGLEAGAARLELTADCIRSLTTEAGTRNRDVEQLERALAEQAAAIRALPVPDAVEVTDAEVERALKAWREKRLEPEYAADFVDMLAALRAARGQG